MPADKAIEALLKENRSFAPSKAVRDKAVMGDSKIYGRAEKDRLKFWEGFAKELIWFKKWNRILEWKLPYAKWFVGGKTNISYNCLDRHLSGSRRNKAAILWEGEPGEERT